jgi:glucose/arabinose dehydrogenase
VRAVPRVVVALTAGIAVVACGGCTSAGAAAGCLLVESGHGPAGDVPIRVERVASGLDTPWALAFLPGGDVLVTERPGRIRIVRGGALEPEPVAVLEVGEEGEAGLLGIAADPAFVENRRVYVYHSYRASGRIVNRLVRLVLAADGRSAALEKVLLDGIPGARTHDGGRVRFGPDGMLYVGTGDARLPRGSQDRDYLGGKLLRLTTEGEPAPGNPVAGNPLLLLGVRNTQAFDWLDPATLVVADHGPSGDTGRSGHDELNVARAGANLGWPDRYACEAGPGTAPVLVFADATPPGGASVYRGDAVPEWKGSVLVGTLGSRHLQRVVLAPDGTLERHEVYLAGDPPAGLGRIRDVAQGPDGALWLTTSNCDGRGACGPEGDLVVRIVRGE